MRIPLRFSLRRREEAVTDMLFLLNTSKEITYTCLLYYSESNFGSSANGQFDFNTDGVLKRDTVTNFENRSAVNEIVGYVYLESVMN